MNKVNRTIGQIAVPAAVLTTVLLTSQPGFTQTMSRSNVSVSAGSDRLLRAGSVTDIPVNTLLQVDGTLRVAGNSQATLKLNAGSLVKGAGSLKVEAGSTLVIDSSQGQLGKVSVDNQGTVVLKGMLDCAQGLDFRNSGTLILDTEDAGDTTDFAAFKEKIKALYPNTGASFTITGTGVLVGKGVLNGNLSVQPGGIIKLSVPNSKSPLSQMVAQQVVRDSSGNLVIRKPAMPSPSPDFMVITGDVTMNTGVMTVEMDSTSYGQLAVTGTVTLGNGTLNCTLLNGYVPAYVDAFRIIKADNIGGSFATFNATALNFDNRGIIAITGGKAYRLSGY